MSFDPKSIVQTLPLTAFGEMNASEPTAQAQVLFPYLAHPEQVVGSIVGTGTATVSGGLITLATGTTAGSQADFTTKDVLSYRAGQGGLLRATAIFSAPATGCVQYFGLGDSAASDGLFFGYIGDNVFYVIRRRGGAYAETVAQGSWNVDPMDGTGPSGMTLDPTKGNVYQIRFQWLGFGAIKFYIENENTGDFQLVHRMDYANANTVPSVNNMSLPARFIVGNGATTSDVSIKTASIALFTEGKVEPMLRLRQSTLNSKGSVTTETNILTIHNKTTYRSVSNRIQVIPDFLSVASLGTGSNPVIFRVWKNVTLGGTPSYADIDSVMSPVEVDTAGTTITPVAATSVQLLAMQLARDTQEIIKLRDLGIRLMPDDYLTVSAESASSVLAAVGLGWGEVH